MKAPLRVSLLAFALAVAAGCGPRQVEVRTAPTTTSEQAVQVTNNLSQAVNVYVTTPSSGQRSSCGRSRRTRWRRCRCRASPAARPSRSRP